MPLSYMVAYHLNHNILEKITNSVYLILCFEINPCILLPIFKFFENVVIWETILQEIKFTKSHKCFSIFTSPVMVGNVIRVELHSLVLENRGQIHEI